MCPAHIACNVPPSQPASWSGVMEIIQPYGERGAETGRNLVAFQGLVRRAAPDRRSLRSSTVTMPPSSLVPAGWRRWRALFMVMSGMARTDSGGNYSIIRGLQIMLAGHMTASYTYVELLTWAALSGRPCRLGSSHHRRLTVQSTRWTSPAVELATSVSSGAGPALSRMPPRGSLLRLE